MVWKKNRPLRRGEMEFHLTGMRQAQWNPTLIDHPAEEIARPQLDAAEHARPGEAQPELRPME